MNQTITPSTAPRAGSAADAPDIFMVLRRYRWLIIGGTLLGAIVSLGLFLFFNRYYPNYTAAVTFQVLPPPQALADKTANRGDLQPSQDEISQFINRQILYIQSDTVLNQALQSDAFQHNPVTGQPSRWLTEHRVNPKKELKKFLVVEPKISAAVFKISITTDDNVEAANLVNAVARVYMDALTSDNKVNQSQQNQQLSDVLQTQQKKVQSMEESLAEFRKANDISAIINLHSLELNLLEQMDAALIRAQSERAALKASLDNINEQVKNGTLQLSADMKQYVENQQELMYLNQTLLALQQERQVQVLNGGTSANTTRGIDARIQTVNDQIAKTRDKLENDAKLRMQERADTDYKSILASTQYMEKSRAEKMAKVQDLDHFMVENQQRMDDLKNQKEIRDDLAQKYTFSLLQNSTDDSRIRKLGGDAVVPEKSEISWPLWYYFVPTGCVLGLLLSYALAYLYELTNTRVRTPQDITRTIQLPLLGFVPDKEDDAELSGALATSIRTSPSSMVAESFRQIRGRLIAQADGHPVSTLLIASIAPGGGATTVASNLANGMALNKMRVLLVDANFYRPGLKANYPNIPNFGLSDVIADPSRLDSSIVSNVELPNLHLMGPGARPAAGTGEILDSKAFTELLGTLKSRYDVVIFDGAPLNLVSDSVSIGARVDGVIAVVKAGEVSRGTVMRVREQLRHVRANLLGVVLNAAQTHGAGYFKENYRTFYEYAGPAPRAVVPSAN